MLLPTVSRAVRAVPAVLLAAVVVAISAPPASAHDRLTGSAPAAGEVMAQAPEVIELTFSNTPVALGSEIAVTNAAGEAVSEGPVVIEGNVVRQDLADGATPGAYTVNWRVVSADAHPIEGTFSYEVEAAAGGGLTGSPAPTAAAGGTSGPSTPATGTPTGQAAAGTPAPLETVESEPSGEENTIGTPAVPWVVAGFGVAVVVIALVLLRGARRRRSSADA